MGWGAGLRRAGPWLVAALGVALVVVGLTLFDLAAWFTDGGDREVVYTGTYGPVDDTVVMWSARQLVGLGTTAVGVAVLAGLGGWLLGRRGVHAFGR